LLADSAFRQESIQMVSHRLQHQSFLLYSSERLSFWQPMKSIEVATPAPKCNIKLLFIRGRSNPQIDRIAQERFSGAVENLDHYDMTADDKKIALLTVYAMNEQTVFSYREAALLLGKSAESITEIMSRRSDGRFGGLNIAQ
jgi:hypothetical protein